jgi:hypothetical protein
MTFWSENGRLALKFGDALDDTARSPSVKAWQGVQNPTHKRVSNK